MDSKGTIASNIIVLLIGGEEHQERLRLQCDHIVENNEGEPKECWGRNFC